MDADDEDISSVEDSTSDVFESSEYDFDISDPGDSDSIMSMSDHYSVELTAERNGKQQQLAILLHAQTCQQNQRQVHEPCIVPNCETTKKVLDHMRICNIDKCCEVVHCAISYDLIVHWGNCEKSGCPLCYPLTIVYEEPRSLRKGNPFEYFYIRKKITENIGCVFPNESLIVDLKESANILSFEERKLLMELTHDGFNLLSWSCCWGKLDFTKFLIENYDAAFLINGLNEKMEMTALHNAIANEYIDIAIFLLQNNANPNIHDRRGHFPLFYTYFDKDPDTDAFKLLIAHGADINKASIITRSTTLKNSETRDEYVEVHGENVVKYVKSLDECIYNRDFIEGTYKGEYEHPLIYCAIHDHYELFEYIVQHPDVPTLTKIQGYEVLGATKIFDQNIGDAITVWETALKMRYDMNEKSLSKEVKEVEEEFMFVKEINSIEELANYPQDSLHMSIQALLILERTAPLYLERYILQLLNLRKLYENGNKFDLAYKLDLKIQKLCHELAPQRFDLFLLFQYAKTLYNMLVLLNKDEWVPTFGEVNQTCQQCINFLKCYRTICCRFNNKFCQTVGPPSLTFLLGCCTLSIHCLIKMMQNTNSVTYENKEMFHNFLKNLSTSGCRDDKQNTLLHIAILQSQSFFSQVSEMNWDIYETLDKINVTDVINVLLEYGFDINGRDKNGNTPLHSYLTLLKFQELDESDVHLIKLLIDKGAHVDTVNKNGSTVKDLIYDFDFNDVLQIHLPFPSLTCLAATVVARSAISVDISDVPAEVHDIIELHQRPSICN